MEKEIKKVSFNWCISAPVNCTCFLGINLVFRQKSTTPFHIRVSSQCPTGLFHISSLIKWFPFHFLCFLCSSRSFEYVKSCDQYRSYVWNWQQELCAFSMSWGALSSVKSSFHSPLMSKKTSYGFVAVPMCHPRSWSKLWPVSLSGGNSHTWSFCIWAGVLLCPLKWAPNKFDRSFPVVGYPHICEEPAISRACHPMFRIQGRCKPLINDGRNFKRVAVPYQMFPFSPFINITVRKSSEAIIFLHSNCLGSSSIQGKMETLPRCTLFKIWLAPDGDWFPRLDDQFANARLSSLSNYNAWYMLSHVSQFCFFVLWRRSKGYGFL